MRAGSGAERRRNPGLERIDGEITVLDFNGRPASIEELNNRPHVSEVLAADVRDAPTRLVKEAIRRAAEIG